jgi:hypothetical protein
MQRVAVRSCPECRSAGSVVGDCCEVCYADFGEGLHVAPAESAIVKPLLFSDVIDELRAAASMVRPTEDDPSRGVEIACRKVEALLGALREQFLADLGVEVR